MEEEPISLDEAEPIVKSLSSLIYKAQDSHYDIATTLMTMKSHIQALEERAHASNAQTTIFGQLAAEAVPKNLHCLNIKLVADWPENRALHKLNSPILEDNNLFHFCVLSDNVLAVSVVVNSTVCNSDRPDQLVFHIVTNGITFNPMQAWFLRNDYQGAAIEVQNIKQFHWLNATYSPVLRKMLNPDSQTYYHGGPENLTVAEPKFRNPKYMSLLNHLRFYIPEIYPHLKKVIFLDDDVVVQKDLTELFSIDLHGNVNGAVETCLESFHRFYKYLNFSNPVINSNFDPHTCGWAFGMNIFDLVAWRKANVTSKYHCWMEMNSERSLWKLGTLPPGLLSFYGVTQPLDRRWHVLGLGYDPNAETRVIDGAAVVHFNGNMKPWLKLRIGRYKHIWNRFRTPSSISMDPQAQQLYKHTTTLIPGLEKDTEWLANNHPLYKYHGFWYIQMYLESVIEAQKLDPSEFNLKPSDIIICSSMKSGTTWLKALAFSVVTRTRFNLFSDNHPLFGSNPHDLIPFIELDVARYRTPRDPDLPLLSTHMPYSALPGSILSFGCKIVYICRNPKDVFVSMWHFMRMFVSDQDFLHLKNAFDHFCEGVSMSGPYWDHVLEYWKASLDNPDKVLFLKYEDMMNDTELHVRRMAEFMGCPFSNGEEKGGAVERIAEMCRFENLSALEVNKIGKHREEPKEGEDLSIPNSVFFRKGKVNDWRNYLSEDMATELDRITVEKLGDSGLML